MKGRVLRAGYASWGLCVRVPVRVCGRAEAWAWAPFCENILGKTLSQPEPIELERERRRSKPRIYYSISLSRVYEYIYIYMQKVYIYDLPFCTMYTRTGYTHIYGRLVQSCTTLVIAKYMILSMVNLFQFQMWLQCGIM